jgi:hypothetical protein
MITLSIYLSLCIPPRIVNTSKELWNKHDTKILETAQKRCGQKYPDSPCVKLFWKTKPKSYRVICGGVKNGDITILPN